MEEVMRTTRRTLIKQGALGAGIAAVEQPARAGKIREGGLHRAVLGPLGAHWHAHPDGL
jgi:hypothetical protein